MGHHRVSVHVNAAPEQVFDLWVDLDSAHEWIEGLTSVTDVSGPFGQAGTRYTSWFGGMKSPSEIVQAERPRLVTTRFGNRLLRGTTRATFEDENGGTRLIQEFWTEGLVSAIVARIFATGSYKGSFRGELNSFVRLVEAQAEGQPPAAKQSRAPDR